MKPIDFSTKRKKSYGAPPEITDNGYIIVGEYCGRDKNGVFTRVCGKCKPKPPKQ